MSANVNVEPDGRRLSAKVGSKLLDVLRGAGILLRTDCGGKGSCGKCLLLIKDQRNVSEVAEIERHLLTSEQIALGYRLACQTIVLGDVAVYIPQDRVGKRRILESGLEIAVEANPRVRTYPLVLSPPKLGKVVSDADNLIHALRSQWSVEVDSIRYGVLKILPDTIRRSGWKIQVVVRDREVIDLRENGDQSIYGLAVDVGTSKLVLQLVELGSGVTVGVESMENPQIVHGEDIYSRMSYAMAGPDRRDELSRLVIQGINSLISEICVKKGVNSEQVYEMVVVGNTAMHHLFLGLPTRHLALSPFVPVIERGMDFSPKDLSVNINPYGNVYMFPVIAGFVGGDAVADIIATGIHRSEKFNLLVDIGTNTEICLGNRDSLICCSCASGPAFEGYHITYGVKAIRGAIERVRILSTSKVEYQTVEGARPVGICGSGMVDALAEMLRNRILTTDGRFNPQLRDALPKYNGTPAFTIAPAEETLIGEAILVTQKDVRELQLAKAAIMTGCKALLEEKNVCEEEVETVYVAGAFGSYLNIRSAIAIGMLPQIPPERFRIVGNTAVVGAKLGLISTSQREEAENIARVAEYLELGARPSFNKEFTQALEFPNIGEP